MSTVTVLDIQRMSSEDGPGLRTTVFLKGCPIACRWCHNPESIAPRGEVLWHKAKCAGCGSCAGLCEHLPLSEAGVAIDRQHCTGCFRCCEACPYAALEAKGTPRDCAELTRELLKDRAYFGAQGGVTVSGGEPLMQEGAVELLRLLKAQSEGEAGFVALDTCGLAPEERLRRALTHCDLVLYDLKLADSAQHLQWTGAGNEAILRNVEIVAAWAKSGGRLWVRTPVIPGATDSGENICAIGELLRGLPVERWELCAFNNLCAAKYESLGLRWAFEDTPLVRQADMARLTEIARQASGVAVHGTGNMS